jgi:uncharacterized protein (DUF488 family)
MADVIATVGYESETIDEFIARLAALKIEQVLDIRELPLSRKRGFSKNGLAAALASVGIAYVHMKPLGDPQPGRQAARAGRIAEFRRIFNQHMRTAEAKEVSPVRTCGTD